MAIPAMDNNDYATEAVRMQGDVDREGRLKFIFSELIEKGWLPEGKGFNWQRVLNMPTVPENAVAWTEVQKNNGTGNTCVAPGNPISTSGLINDWSAQQTAFVSEPICVIDGQMSYLEAQQTLNRRKNFQDCIDDAWGERDRFMYILKCANKYVATDSLDNTQFSTSFPLIPATNYANRSLLDYFYRKLHRMNAMAMGGAVSYKDGKPIFRLVCSSEVQQQIIMSDPNVREDFRFAQMGEDRNAQLLKTFGINQTYAGFAMFCDDRMPRYDFVDGAWVERPFLANTGTPSFGVDYAEVTTAYDNAEYEDIIFFHPEVVKRRMLPSVNTLGADTKFGPYNFVGRITWLNILNEETNPIGTVGKWRADLIAGYEPNLLNYGIVVRVNRCTNSLYSWATCVR